MKKPKRRRYIVIAAFGVVAVTLMYCASGSDREVASIDGFWALDEGGAVIVWRATHQSRRATGSVTRLDASGKEIWTMPLPEAPMGPVSIVDGAMIVHYCTVAPASPYSCDTNAIARPGRRQDALGSRVGDEYWVSAGFRSRGRKANLGIER